MRRATMAWTASTVADVTGVSRTVMIVAGAKAAASATIHSASDVEGSSVDTDATSCLTVRTDGAPSRMG